MRKMKNYKSYFQYLFLDVVEIMRLLLQLRISCLDLNAISFGKVIVNFILSRLMEYHFSDLKQKAQVLGGEEMSSVTSLAISKNSLICVAGFGNGYMKLFDLQKKKSTLTFEQAHLDEVSALVLSSDDRCLVSGSQDKSIKIWDLVEKRIVHEFKAAHNSGVRSLALTSDNERIISCCDDLKIWSVKTKTFVEKLGEKSNNIFLGPMFLQTKITCMTLTSDDKLLVTGYIDSSIKFWDLSQKTNFHTISEAHHKGVTSIVISKDNQTMITGSIRDKAIKLWDLKQIKLIHTFEQPEHVGVAALQFCFQSQCFISASSGLLDKTIKLWDLTEKRVVHTFEKLSDEMTTLGVTNSDQYLIAGSQRDKNLIMWDLRSKKFVHMFQNAHKNQVTSVTVTNNGDYLISASKGSFDSTIKIWDFAKRKCIHTFSRNQVSSAIVDVLVTPDDQLFITIEESYGLFHSNKCSINIWDFQERRIVHSFSYENDVVTAIALSKDGKYLVAALSRLSNSNIHDIKVYNLYTKKCENTIHRTHRANITKLVVSKGGNYLISGSVDRSFSIWDLAKKSRLATVSQIHMVTSMVLTNDDKYLIVGSDAKTIQIWDWKKRKSIHIFHQAHVNAVTSLAVTSDGRFLMSGCYNERSIKFWDIKGLRPFFKYSMAHAEGISCLRVSHDDHILISGSTGGCIKFTSFAEQKLPELKHNSKSSPLPELQISMYEKEIEYWKSKYHTAEEEAQTWKNKYIQLEKKSAEKEAYLLASLSATNTPIKNDLIAELFSERKPQLADLADTPIKDIDHKADLKSSEDELTKAKKIKKD